MLCNGVKCGNMPYVLARKYPRSSSWKFLFFTPSYCLERFPTSNTSCKVQYGWECVYFSLSRPHPPSSSPSIDTFTIMQELFHPSMKISKKISVRKMLQYYFSLPPPPPVCVVIFDWCFHIFAITTKKKPLKQIVDTAATHKHTILRRTSSLELFPGEFFESWAGNFPRYDMLNRYIEDEKPPLSWSTVGNSTRNPESGLK